MNELSKAIDTLDHQLREAIAVDPLKALSAMCVVRALIADHEREAVRVAVAQHSWSEIGDALGVSKQAAFQRFGKAWVTDMKAAMTRSEMARALRQRLSR